MIQLKSFLKILGAGLCFTACTYGVNIQSLNFLGNVLFIFYPTINIGGLLVQPLEHNSNILQRLSHYKTTNDHAAILELLRTVIHQPSLLQIEDFLFYVTYVAGASMDEKIVQSAFELLAQYCWVKQSVQSLHSVPDYLLEGHLWTIFQSVFAVANYTPLKTTRAAALSFIVHYFIGYKHQGHYIYPFFYKSMSGAAYGMGLMNALKKLLKDKGTSDVMRGLLRNWAMNALPVFMDSASQPPVAVDGMDKVRSRL